MSAPPATVSVLAHAGALPPAAPAPPTKMTPLSKPEGLQSRPRAENNDASAARHARRRRGTPPAARPGQGGWGAHAPRCLISARSRAPGVRATAPPEDDALLLRLFLTLSPNPARPHIGLSYQPSATLLKRLRCDMRLPLGRKAGAGQIVDPSRPIATILNFFFCGPPTGPASPAAREAAMPNCPPIKQGKRARIYNNIFFSTTRAGGAGGAAGAAPTDSVGAAPCRAFCFSALPAGTRLAAHRATFSHALRTITIMSIIAFAIAPLPIARISARSNAITCPD